ncbi:MAG: class I SAM-dependent methyltransferase [Anaerolineaceae bacterium]|nr:class I SAM-dependent methyltransferase [Anaerolineaceae bacterium]
MSQLFKIPEPVSRASQADKIYRILEEHLKENLEGKRILEIGCGSGEISVHLSKRSAFVWGIEIDPLALFKESYTESSNFALSLSDGRHLPFADESIDIIILPQVYEHIKEQKALISGMFRVLEPGGVCFFSGPNRWQIIEPHYFLPFLSWLPHKLADIYLRISGRGKCFDVYPRSYWGIKRLLRQFKVIDYTWHIIKEPEKYGLSSSSLIIKVMKRLPDSLLKLLRPVYTNYNWILVKKD